MFIASLKVAATIQMVEPKEVITSSQSEELDDFEQPQGLPSCFGFVFITVRGLTDGSASKAPVKMILVHHNLDYSQVVLDV